MMIFHGRVQSRGSSAERASGCVDFWIVPVRRRRRLGRSRILFSRAPARDGCTTATSCSTIPHPTMSDHPVVDESLIEGDLTAEKAKDHGWYRWEQVKQHCLPERTLFRASSPNYKSPREDPVNGGDKSQTLTQNSVDWLVKNKINILISFNRFPYKPEELSLLEKANITYRHHSTVDYTSPSIEDLKAAVEFHAQFKDAATLVHCGYGHGRTGTGISAIQLYAEDGERPTAREWIVDNRVEIMAKDQVANLMVLADFYKNNPRRVDGGA